MKLNKMITISIIITALGLLIAAVGVSFFRYFSSQKTERSFEVASDERKKIKTKMDEEFERTIHEMSVHKDSLNQKVEKETSKIIEQLKEKSANANEALERLKNQTEKAEKVISNDVTKLKEITKKGISELSHPLPNELIPLEIEVTINSDGFKKFLPELQAINKRNDSYLKELVAKKMTSTTGLGYGFISDDVMKIIDGKTLTIQVNGTDDGPRKKAIKGFIWQFDTNISIENNENQYLSYNVYHGRDKLDELALRIIIRDKSQQSGLMRVFGGISSALELCGKKVWMTISIDGTGVQIPVYSIKRLSFKDNNSKDYSINITGTESISFTIPKTSESELYGRTYETIYMTGQIECLSF